MRKKEEPPEGVVGNGGESTDASIWKNERALIAQHAQIESLNSKKGGAKTRCKRGGKSGQKGRDDSATDHRSEGFHEGGGSSSVETRGGRDNILKK